MARIFITGSSDGLGLAAARTLVAQGHYVVLHARSRARADSMDKIEGRANTIVIGDLSSAEATRSVADQVNDLRQMDAVIHNAGIYREASRGNTAEGHATMLAVNTLAPYLLTKFIERPKRLVYLSSGMHRGGAGSLRDIDWTERRWNATQAYSETKLQLVALSNAIARHWPKVLSNAVDPGWVATKMGGAGAPDSLDSGQATQTWLAASDDPAVQVSGGYWHHRRQQAPASEATDEAFQDKLVAKLAELTGVHIFDGAARQGVKPG